jgi:uncharacterized iron-regulated protein
VTFSKLWVWLLVGLLAWTSPVLAQSIFPLPSAIAFTSYQQQILQALSNQTVIYLGETHDQAEDHQAQLEIIQALHRQNPSLAIAFEMFQHPYQKALDSYLAGNLTETELQEKTEYKKRWGYPWEFYAPILRFAKEKQIRAIALNAPSEITRKVARRGLQALTIRDRQLIPPFSELRPEPESYRDRIRQIYDGFHRGKGNSAQFENFFLAQIVWDETMADRISQFLRKHPKTQVVVLAGQGHVIYGEGIPSRVVRRIESVKQSIVLLNPADELLKPPAGDYFWRTSP